MAKHFSFKNDEVIKAYGVTQELQRKIDTICALFEIDNPVNFAIRVVESLAVEHAKGKTEIACLSPRMANLITDNPEFFQALSEEGVLEWIAPLVLGKIAQIQ